MIDGREEMAVLGAGGRRSVQSWASDLLGHLSSPAQLPLQIGTLGVAHQIQSERVETWGVRSEEGSLAMASEGRGRELV